MNDEFCDWARNGANFVLDALMIVYIYAGYGNFESDGQKALGAAYFGIFCLVRMYALWDVLMRAKLGNVYTGRGTAVQGFLMAVSIAQIFLFRAVQSHYSDTVRLWGVVELVAMLQEPICELARQRIARTGSIFKAVPDNMTGVVIRSTSSEAIPRADINRSFNETVDEEE